MNGVKITGVGKATPQYHMTNEEISKIVETSDEWIRSRTGIGGRYISKGETTTDLAIRAAANALEMSGLKNTDIDRVIVASISPDSIMPSIACNVQAALELTGATAFDLTAACSGFIYGSRLAAEAILSNQCEHVLVIGAETLSKTLNWEDRSTCVLFGDGAGAAIFSRSSKNHILSMDTGSNGMLGKVLTLPGIEIKNPIYRESPNNQTISMDGREVYRFATTIVPQSIQKVVQESGHDIEEIDYFILHQANARIMDSVAKKLKIDTDKFYKNLEHYGNTSAASIAIALAEVAPSLKTGDLIVLCGFGGGLTWGSVCLEW